MTRTSFRTRRLALLSLAIAATACADPKGDDDRTRPGDDRATPYVGAPPTPGAWFQPSAKDTWQWQIEGELHASYDVRVYDIDLFENDAATMAELRAAGRAVICYFSAGTFEPWRDDAGAYPAAIVGAALADWPDERWVDVRSKTLRAILARRLDLAAEKGCDAVEPDNVTAFRNESGFDLTPEDQLDFNRWLADEAHARGLGVGLKNDGDQAIELAPWFDFSVNEECHAYDECAELSPFLDAEKPVFNAEYAEDEAEAVALAATLCPNALAAGTRTLILPLDLDDAFRVSCDTPQK